MKIVLPNRGLNTAVLHIAQRLNPCGFDVVPEDQAPATLGQLQTYVARHNRIAVSEAHSENSIFVDREVNYAFRAWHDWCHWRHSYSFNIIGERACAQVQMEHVRTLFGNGPDADLFCAVIDEEVNGQAAYQAARGEFPEHQFRFAQDYLRAMGHEVTVEWASWLALSGIVGMEPPVREMLHAA